MLTVLIIVILSFWGLAKIIEMIDRAGMSPDQHREEGYRLLQAAANDTKAKRIQGNYAAAQAHFEIADEQDRRA